MNKIKIDMRYVMQITRVISILHDMKHDGTLPKKLEKWRGWIERFDPNKIEKQSFIIYK